MADANSCLLYRIILDYSDRLLVKSIVTGIAKGGIKLSGSFAWPAVRKWLGSKGLVEAGEHMHHSIIPKSAKWCPDFVKNQLPNLKRLSPALHYGVHGYGPRRLNTFQRIWFGTTNWVKNAAASIAGRVANLLR